MENLGYTEVIKEIRRAFVSGKDDDHLHIDIMVSSKKFRAGDDVMVTIEKIT